MDPNTTKIKLSSARQRNAIKMAFCWRADDDPTLNAGLVALWFFRGSGPVLQRNPIFLWFFRGGGGVWTPCPPPLDPPMNMNLIDTRHNLTYSAVPFVTHFIHYNTYSHVMAPIFFTMEFLQRNNRKMAMDWSFYYNYLSSNNVVFWQVKTQTSLCSLLLS